MIRKCGFLLIYVFRVWSLVHGSTIYTFTDNDFSLGMFLHICFWFIYCPYPRIWDPDSTFCTCLKESLSAEFFPWPKSGDSQKINWSLRYAWSFSLCLEVGVGQENSICVFSLILQPGISSEHSQKKLILCLPRCRPSPAPEVSPGSLGGRDPLQGTSTWGLPPQPHSHLLNLVAPQHSHFQCYRCTRAPALLFPGRPCSVAAIEKLQPWTQAILRKSSKGVGGGWRGRTLNSLSCLTCCIWFGFDFIILFSPIHFCIPII